MIRPHPASIILYIIFLHYLQSCTSLSVLYMYKIEQSVICTCVEFSILCSCCIYIGEPDLGNRRDAVFCVKGACMFVSIGKKICFCSLNKPKAWTFNDAKVKCLTDVSDWKK